jgi:hypothetical protein
MQKREQHGVPLTPGINDVVVDEINTYGRDFFTRLKEGK